MSLEQKITADYIQAMKDRDSVKSGTLSFLRAQMKNVLIDLPVRLGEPSARRADKAGQRPKELADADVIGVIKKQIKQRQDSIEQYEKGNRLDLADKEKQEMAILKSYLPQEMSQEKVQQVVADAIKETKAQGLKDMGTVMKVVLAKVAGQADGKLVSNLVKEALSKL